MNNQKSIYTSHQYDILYDFKSFSIIIHYKKNELYAEIFFEHAKTYINFYKLEKPNLLYAQGNFSDDDVWQLPNSLNEKYTNKNLNIFIDKIIPIANYLLKQIEHLKDPFKEINVNLYKKNEEEINYLYVPDLYYNSDSKFITANAYFQIYKTGKMICTITESDNSDIISLPLNIQNFEIKIQKEFILSNGEINYLFNSKTTDEKCKEQIHKIFHQKINTLLEDPYINKDENQAITWLKGSKEEFEKTLHNLVWLISRKSKDELDTYTAKYICIQDEKEKPDLNIYGIDLSTTVKYFYFIEILKEKYIALGWEIIQEYAGKPNRESDFIFANEAIEFQIEKPSPHQLIDSKIYLKEWIEKNIPKNTPQYVKITNLFNEL